jgi:hypothetical protein
VSDKIRFIRTIIGGNILILLRFFGWCPGAESNHRHRDFQSPYSPYQIRHKLLVKARNSRDWLEANATFCLSSRRRYPPPIRH